MEDALGASSGRAFFGRIAELGAVAAGGAALFSIFALPVTRVCDLWRQWRRDAAPMRRSDYIFVLSVSAAAGGIFMSVVWMFWILVDA